MKPRFIREQVCIYMIQLNQLKKIKYSALVQPLQYHRRGILSFSRTLILYLIRYHQTAANHHRTSFFLDSDMTTQQKKFLNVRFGQLTTRIKTNDIEDISELQDAIKAKYGDRIPAPPAAIQLYKCYPDERIVRMADFRALPNEFFVEDGPNVEIHTSPPPSKQSSLKNIIPFPPNSGAVHEGLPEASKPKIGRSALVNKISNTMKNQMSLLITSPSFTGKTSLANLMYNHWQQQGKTVHYISFASLRPEDDLYAFFLRKLQLPVHEIIENEGYLIMDETQNVYSHPTFWGSLKSGAQVCRVLAFGVFGLSTAGFDRSPTQFQMKWYYDDVKFTDEECRELVESFKQFQPIAREIVIPEILGDLFQLLNNHPGLVYLALHTLCYEFTRSPYNARGISDILLLVAKGELTAELFTKARCFVMTYGKLRQMLGDDTDQIMQRLILNDFIPLNGEDKLVDLHRSGICIADRTERTLKFSSEIMRIFYRNLYYKAIYGVNGSNVITDWNNETVHILLKRILELFNPRVFINTQAIGRNGQRYERIYQDEFYRCCYMLAPSQCHPDVGAIYGSRGFLDFYIDSELQWGFELLRNGDKLKGHLERFNPTRGTYRDIPLRDYAVVDFYETVTDGAVDGEKYYRVVFSNDFKTIHLFHNGASEQIVCGETQ